LPQVDADDDGDALMVWERHDTHTNWRIAARRVSRSSPRSTVHHLFLTHPRQPLECAAVQRVVAALLGL
jgi:hypothetical protein